MALVICPDCGKSISDAALACLACGRPMHDMAPATVATAPLVTAAPPVLIEQSSKKYKRGMLIGLGLLPLGFLVAMISAGLRADALANIALIVMLLGVAIFIWNVVARWWNHG